MKRLLMVGALGVLLALGVSTVASAAPSFGSSTLGGTPPGSNIALIVSSHLISQTIGHSSDTLVFSQTGGFGGGPLSGGGFQQQIVVQLSTHGSSEGEFTYTGTGILAGPLVGATTVQLAQGFTVFGEGEIPPVNAGTRNGVKNVVSLGSSFSTASLFQDSLFEATMSSSSKTATLSIELGTLEVPDGLAAMVGFNLLPGTVQATLPAGTVAVGPYGVSWTIH